MVDEKKESQGFKDDCKLVPVFRQANIQYTDEQKQALKLRAQEVGCMEEKLIGWEEKGVLVWGYTHYDIALELGLKYEIDWRSFASEEAVLAEISDIIMLLPTVTLFAKIEIAKPFGSFWKNKYDSNHPICKEALQRFGSTDELGIVAVKAGTSRVTVSKVNRILECPDESLIARCRAGEISITAAHDSLSQPEATGSATAEQTEVKDKTALDAENRRLAGKLKLKTKEISALAKYAKVGFSDGTKLTKSGLKFFVKRWNDEHAEVQITEDELEKGITDCHKDEHATDKQ